MLAVSRRGERGHAHNRRTRGHSRDQRFGEVPQAQEIDRDNEQWVAYPRGDACDVEKRIDTSCNGCRRAIDRLRVGEIDLMKLVDFKGRPLFVQSDDVGPEFGELSHHMFADARRTPGYHRTTTVVSPKLVNLSQHLR